MLIIFIYFLTRLPFLRFYPVFYDSFEYANFPDINSTHQPIHTLYLLTINFVRNLTLVSFIFGLLTVVVWYRLLINSSFKKIAFFSTLLILIYPYFFVANTNILYESELLFFQVLALYLLLNQKPLAAGLSFGLAQLIFIGNIILLPLYLILIFLKSAGKIKGPAFFIASFFTISVIVDRIILGSFKILQIKYSSHLFDVISTNNGIVITVGRIVRNIFIQTSAILSIPGLVFLLIALTVIFVKNKKIFLLLTFSILPFILLEQYWQAGFYGRLATGIVFPASLATAYVFRNKFIRFLIIFLISLSTINFAIAQRQQPPIYSYFGLIKNYKNLSMITSDYNRFLYEKNDINIFALKGNNTNELENFIDQNLIRRKTVLLDSQALFYPYWQYDGNFYQLLSKNNHGQPDAKMILSKYNLIMYVSDKKNPNIFFLRIIDKK